MDRRQFLQITSVAIGVASLSPLYGASLLEGVKNAVPAPQDNLRTLGRSGLKYTPLGFGAMRTSDPAVIRRGVDLGINNIDTARGYMDGENERIVAKAISGIRDKVHLTTKIKQGSLRAMESDLNASLKALNTDHVDILLRHGISRTADLKDEDTRRFLENAKQSGKTRCIGFSTHRNMAPLLRAAADDGLFDVVLAAYNFTHGEEVTEAINYASGKGIGVIAMKTQAGGYKEESTGNLNPHQAALKWVLSNTAVTSAIPSMVTFQQVEENHKVLGAKFGWMDRKTLYRYGNAIDDKLCRFCDNCAGTCPRGVSVPDLNRCVMYVDGYGDTVLARRAYREIASQENALQCRDCDECVVQCRHGVKIAANMQRATELFT